MTASPSRPSIVPLQPYTPTGYFGVARRPDEAIRSAGGAGVRAPAEEGRGHRPSRVLPGPAGTQTRGRRGGRSGQGRGVVAAGQCRQPPPVLLLVDLAAGEPLAEQLLGRPWR